MGLARVYLLDLVRIMRMTFGPRIASCIRIIANLRPKIKIFIRTLERPPMGVLCQSKFTHDYKLPILMQNCKFDWTATYTDRRFLIILWQTVADNREPKKGSICIKIYLGIDHSSLTLYINVDLGSRRIDSSITTINHDLLTMSVPTRTRCKVDDGASHFLATVIKNFNEP